MRRRIFWLLCLAFVWLVISNWSQIKKVVSTLAGGDLLWIAAAGGVMAIYYLVYAVSFRVAYGAVGIKRSIGELLPVIFGMLFVNLAMPSGGSAGVALFMDDAARRGHSAARTMSGTILQFLADFSSLSVALVASLIYMRLRGTLFSYQIVAASIQVTLTLVLSASLMLGLWSPRLLLDLLRGLENVANKLLRLLRRSHSLPDGWAEGFAEELTAASRSIARHPSELGGAFLSMLMADALAMGALYLLFLAFRTPVSLGAVAVGYVVGILFWMIPLTPEGVGLVEGAMTITFVSFGVPAIPAAAVTLSFRGLIFWLPMVIGFVLLRKVKTFEDVLGSTRAAPVSATSDDRQMARDVVRAYGRTSQAHLALLDDKTYYFTPGGSVVAYTVRGRTAVTLGDPIGPREDAECAIRGFMDLCRRNRWMAVFAMAEADCLDIYQRLGYRSLCLGYEAVVDLASFTLRGNAHKALRKRFSRLALEGYSLVVCEPPLNDATLRELRQINDAWIAMTHSQEKRFFLGCFDENYIRQERVALIRTPGAEISAFADLTPEYQRGGLGIDLMRHRPRCESGTMDFLFVSLLFWSRAHGYATFNLGLSPLFGVGTQPGAALLEKLIHLVYEHGAFYNFKGLNGFKAKFRPRWTPLYMVFPGFPSLPAAGLALAKVTAGDGQSLRDFFRGHRRRGPIEEAERTALQRGVAGRRTN